MNWPFCLDDLSCQLDKSSKLKGVWRVNFGISHSVDVFSGVVIVGNSVDDLLARGSLPVLA